MKVPKMSNGFVLTDWNLNSNENYLKIMKENNIRFLAYGLEHTEKGIPHHQAFLYFENTRATSTRNLGKMGNLWGEKHCYMYCMIGAFQSNKDYCDKESELTKLGDEPAQGYRGDLKETIRLITNGEIKPYDILLESPQTFNLYKNSFTIAHNLFLKKNFRTEMTKGFWIWGSTGTGKSEMAFKNFNYATHFKKDLNVIWWDNYEQQKIVIFDEFRGQIKYSELLSLCDKYPKDVPIRNHPSIPFTSKIIVITSCSPPEKIYYNALDDEDSIEQFNRRFVVVERRKNDGEVVLW